MLYKTRREQPPHKNVVGGSEFHRKWSLYWLSLLLLRYLCCSWDELVVVYRFSLMNCTETHRYTGSPPVIAAIQLLDRAETTRY